MPIKKLSIEIVNHQLREMYGDHAMFRYKKDEMGNITTCSVGRTDKDGKVYFVTGMSDKGDWQACLTTAKRLARDQHYQIIQL